MMTYFIKEVFCSLLFFLFYKLLFENEKMLVFNRVYLLLSIMFSFIVPFVTVHTYSQILPLVKTNIPSPAVFNSYNNIQASVPGNTLNILPFIVLSIYVTISTFLLFRFGRNLTILFLRISKSNIIPYNNAKLVLINDNLIPYSFLNYIFINNKDYINGKIEQEILLHEFAHVQQKHSIDILFVELLQAIFWFNPVFIFYRKTIQLNHEFLADNHVINTCHDTTGYQYLLLNAASQKKSSLLTNHFNYLITKKRLIMMTKSTSATKVLCRQIALVPLSAAAIFMFSTNTIAQATNIAKPLQKESQSTKGVSQEMLEEYQKIINDNKLSVQYNRTNPPVVSEADKDRLEVIYFAMNKAQQAKQTVTFEHPTPMSKNSLTEKQFESFKNSKAYAITLNDKKVDNRILDKYKHSDFANFSVIYLAKTNSNYRKHLPIDVYLMTKEYYKIYVEEFAAEKKSNIMITMWKYKKS